jgi:hypothetical protein
LNPRNVGKPLIMHGAEARQRNDAAFARTEPAMSTVAEGMRPLLAVREKNRRRLAKEYIDENPVEDRDTLPCPDPEMEERCRIDSISSQPSALHAYAAPRSKGTKWRVDELAGRLREGDGNARRVAAEKLAMIVSDPEIYLKETSMAALKALVLERLVHNTSEAKEALESLGLDLEKLPRIELRALIAPRYRLWISRKLRESLRSIEERLENGF